MTSAFCGNSICKNDSSFCMIISLVQDQFAMNFAGFYSHRSDKLDVFTPTAALNSRFILDSPALNCTWSLDRELQSFNKNYNNAFCTQIFTLQLEDVQKQCTTQQFLQTSSMHKVDIFVFLLISQFLSINQLFQKCLNFLFFYDLRLIFNLYFSTVFLFWLVYFLSNHSFIFNQLENPPLSRVLVVTPAVYPRSVVNYNFSYFSL